MVTLDPITGGNFAFRATAVGVEKTSGSRDDADVIAVVAPGASFPKSIV
jgi:hypothetical protein